MKKSFGRAKDMNMQTYVGIKFYSIKNISQIMEKSLCTLIYEYTLTLYGPNSFFRRFSGHNLR